MEQKSITDEIEEYKKRHGIILEGHNETVRKMIESEATDAANEEREHSRSPVGDRENMREVQD